MQAFYRKATLLHKPITHSNIYLTLKNVSSVTLISHHSRIMWSDFPPSTDAVRSQLRKDYSKLTFCYGIILECVTFKFVTFEYRNDFVQPHNFLRWKFCNCCLRTGTDWESPSPYWLVLVRGSLNFQFDWISNVWICDAIMRHYLSWQKYSKAEFSKRSLSQTYFISCSSRQLLWHFLCSCLEHGHDVIIN